MKNLLNILLLTMMTLLLPGCVATKQVSTKETSSQDRTAIKSEVRTAESVSKETGSITKDTTIGIPERKVSESFTAEELKPVVNSKGDTVGTEKVFEGTGKNKGVKGKLTVNKDGSADVECTADSLALVIQGLRSEWEYSENRFDSLYMQYAFSVNREKQLSSELKVVETRIWMNIWFWIWVVAAVAIGWVIGKIY